MTPEAQRIAIAEACGWKRDKRDRWRSPLGHYYENQSPPDYLNDLNAMHEAEKVLRDSNFGATTERATYINKLETIVCREAGKSGWSWALTHATAPQRAEAFLRTLGKWTK